jgi:hypothetical protein
MHSHDRTLLARLGFSDPDKKDPRHDLACQYLALRENQERMVDVVLVGELKARRITRLTLPPEWEESPVRNVVRAYENKHVERVSLEVPVSKGSGQYKTTIGFLDGRTRWVVEERLSGEIRRWTRDSRSGAAHISDDWTPFNERGRHDWDVGIEVKIAPVGIGDALRQIKLYREHMGDGYGNDGNARFVLATAYPMESHDVAALKAERITHIRLGPKFDEWVAARKAEAASSESPEF